MEKSESTSLRVELVKLVLNHLSEQLIFEPVESFNTSVLQTTLNEYLNFETVCKIEVSDFDSTINGEIQLVKENNEITVVQFIINPHAPVEYVISDDDISLLNDNGWLVESLSSPIQIKHFRDGTKLINEEALNLLESLN